jgi:glycosyltransferase involved in cell wall biosynthesis
VTGADRETRDRPTTVIHLITTLSQGGAERALDESVPRPGSSAGERHIVVSLASGGMFADRMASEGVDVRSLGMRPGKDLIRGTFRLVRLLREVQPDAIIAWMYHAIFLSLISHPLAGFAVRSARQAWVIQNSLQSTIGSPWHTRVILRYLAHRSAFPDAIAVNSLSGQVHHADFGFRARQWHHLPNGCNTDRFAPDGAVSTRTREALGIDPLRPIAIFVGRHHPEKGLDLLLSALELLPPKTPGFTLLLVGIGTDHARITENHHVEVLALGERTDVPDLLKAADVLVLPSRTEGTPNAVIEAMATGVPCVVSDVGDSAAVVGATGVIVPPMSPTLLASGLAEMLSMDVTERTALGTAARKRIIERYSLKNARASYRSLWSQDPA